MFRYDHNYRSLLFKLLTFTPNSWQRCVADITTDGKWFYIVFWLLPQSLLTPIRWGNVKSRLLPVCPPCTFSFYLDPPPSRPVSPVYLLKFCCSDRRGLLHVYFHFFKICFMVDKFSLEVLGLINIILSFADVTHVLCDLELVIQRVKSFYYSGWSSYGHILHH